MLRGVAVGAGGPVSAEGEKARIVCVCVCVCVKETGFKLLLSTFHFTWRDRLSTRYTQLFV